ncbi:hemerythrin domain-containing protein [Actibacterium ureilyticum]|uniref:hemerythrin domain-containing protein n=1 Tax=Actibacterium ureilyticum TaxID=1590614 RepID=UPI000BAA99DF|nr:hemerythrin domain-containing protein [Actibacterium ureilyticum]
MKNELSNIRRGNVDIEPTNLELMENPLEFIKEDHMHMRSVCESIDHLAQAEVPDRVQLSRIISFLEHEIGLLIHDEDDDLRELLLKRCLPEDNIASTLDRLKDEHVLLSGMLPLLKSHLASIRDDERAATEPEADDLREFADRLRRHLLVENAIILPLARVRLTNDDIVQLRNAMIRRRIEDMQA